MRWFSMPTVLRVRNIRVVVYPNDHPPPHVHAVRGERGRAKFVLNCPEGPVELMEQGGFKLSEIHEIGAGIAAILPDVCAKWRLYHG